jgi:RNA polymerase sigma-70 factor (ECF subfamily)
MDQSLDDMMRLVGPLIPALRRYARAMVRDRWIADDLVQDCLERVISRWHQRRDDGGTRKWVFAIMHNLAIDQLRRARPRAQDVPLDGVNSDTLGARATQEDGLRYADVVRALEQLPPEQRSVLLLVSVEEMSYGEVAKALDIPTGTVTSRLSRARNSLARIIRAPAAPDTHAHVPAADNRPKLRRVK